MTPTDLARKALAALALASLSACGSVESDPDRFETIARRVADIRLTPEPSHDAPGAPSASRDAERRGLEVVVMDPHDLWEARDGGLTESGLRGMIDVAAPVVTEVMAERVTQVVAEGLRPALAPETMAEPVSTAAVRVAGVTIQLGAYSSEAAAREAWARFGEGPASTLLAGLSPVFEPVEANGRRLVRLKVASATAGAAASICRAARINDPWCQAAGRV